MSSLKKFKKQKIKQQLSNQRYTKIFNESKEDGSLMRYIEQELSKELNLEQEQDNEVVDAEIVEVIEN